jgi:hypothetical protein
MNSQTWRIPLNRINISKSIATISNIINFFAYPQKGPFWSKLVLEISKGNGRKIHAAPTPIFDNDDDVKCYGYAMYALRKNIIA